MKAMSGTRERFTWCSSLPNDIEFSGERKRVRCNEGLGVADGCYG
jgi:hypothetical protein